MSILALAASAILLAQTPALQETPTATQPPPASHPAPQLTPAQQRARDRTQAERICSRRAPTGRRLEQTTCITRELAAAQARASQDELDKNTLQSGWQIERGN